MKVDAKVDQHAVEGFSQRFTVLLDRSGVPKENRISHCAKRFGVVHNTFKGWCTRDRPPKSYNALYDIVEALLKDIAGEYDDNAVTAWLLAGDSVANPFEDGRATLRTFEIFLQVVELAKKKGIEFDQLDREARALILEKTRNAVVGTEGTVAEEGGQLKLSNSTAAMVSSLLEMASTLSKK